MSRCKSCDQPMDCPATNPYTKQPEELCPTCIGLSRDNWPIRYHQFEGVQDGVTQVKKTT